MMANLLQPLFASSFDWEGVIPIIFFVVYFLSQVLGTKKGAEAPDEAAENEEAEARARQIREEIRRRIEERRQASDGAGQPSQQPAPPRYDPTQPERLAPVYPRFDPNEVESPRPVWTPPVADAPRAQPASRTAAPAEPSMLERLREQRQRLEASQREQASARAQAQAIVKNAYATGQGRAAKSSPQSPWRKRVAATTAPLTTREAILIGLRDPATVREAVLYREILGPPPGLAER